jgi:hypothetical protein
VITDDSNLYPAVLAELWPEAEHQLCVFRIVPLGLRGQNT